MKRKFRMNDLIMKLILSIGSLTISCPLYAQWIPEDSLIDLDPSRFDNLIDIDYIALKGYVLDALKDSWCSQEKAMLLMDLVYLTQPEICVEIGAFTGSSTLPIAATLKLLNHGGMYAIDAWSNQEAIKNLAEDDPNKPWWSIVHMGEVRRIFDEMIRSWNLSSFCTSLAEPSMKAIYHLPEIDFLHLDGDYSEIGSLNDVELYLPKVKSGGYILLSNVYLTVNAKQPKLKSFYSLFESCEIVSEIDNSNTVLFRKL